MKQKSSYFLFIFLIISFDQITKTFASSYFSITCNTGVAFGINLPFGVFLPLIFLFLIFYLLLKEKDNIKRISFSFILAGGMSNLLDRIILGCVRDFITIRFFPSFNFADIAITLGVVIFLLNIRNFNSILDRIFK